MSNSNSMTGMDAEQLAELHRTSKDALDLAMAAGAPLSLLEKLAASAALLEALVELPRHALIPDVVARASRALAAWNDWRKLARRNVAA
jgi:hypothetical protein